MAEVYEGAGVSGEVLETRDSIMLVPLEMALVMAWREGWPAVKHSRQRLPTR